MDNSEERALTAKTLMYAAQFLDEELDGWREEAGVPEGEYNAPAAAMVMGLTVHSLDGEAGFGAATLLEQFCLMMGMDYDQTLEITGKIMDYSRSMVIDGLDVQDG